MKKVLKRITASLMSGLMLFGSTYSVLGSVSAASNEYSQEVCELCMEM